MDNVEISLNTDGVRALLKEVGETTCMSIANKVLNRCGDGYAVKEIKYPERTAALVKAVTQKSARENAENNTILKALGG